MKILFINPSLRLNSKNKLLPVGLASVMTYVGHCGYDFDLFDVDINDYSDDVVEEYVATHKYDVVLYGSIVTHYKWMKWLTRTIKKYHPDTFIVVGNSVAGSVPEVFLRNSLADIAVIGEGEITAVEIINALENNTSYAEIEGIGFLDSDGKYIQTKRREAKKKIDDFPLINWDYFDVEKYIEKESQAAFDVAEEGEIIRAMPVNTARGCVFRCTFCHFVFWNDPYRYRSPESIMKEISRNINKYAANYFFLWDDLSFASLNQAERLADEILKSGLKFRWGAAVRTDLFGNPKHSYEKRMQVAQKCKDAGCVSMGYSLESGDQEILEMMDKHINAEYFKEQADLLRKVGIISYTSIVFGYPIETKETIKRTFSMCLEAKTYPSIGFLLPLPMTPMYEYAKENGFISSDNEFLDSITERQDICLNMTSMTDQELMDAITDGASELKDKLGIKLKKESLVRTGGYREHTKSNKRIKRKENDISFNYSESEFDFDDQHASE